jgi:hypothetical protein
MKPLAQLDARAIDALLFDIDETLTTEGKLTAQAYAALEKLHAARRRVVAVTGRPAGWCDHIARMWPVDAVVGENGAFYFCFAEGKLHKRFADDEKTRAAKRGRLDAIAKTILKQVPAAPSPGPALPRDRPCDRLLRGRAALAAGGGRAHRYLDARRWPDGASEFDPR